MSVTKRILLPALLALALGAGALVEARAQQASSPEELVALWQEALEQRDFTGYVACLHSGARQIPEYGSREAMEFWAGEIEGLAREGFAGQFEIEPVTDGGTRFPPGSLRAYPIVNGRRVDDALVLVQEAGRWAILRIFS